MTFIIAGLFAYALFSFVFFWAKFFMFCAGQISGNPAVRRISRREIDVAVLAGLTSLASWTGIFWYLINKIN